MSQADSLSSLPNPKQKLNQESLTFGLKRTLRPTKCNPVSLLIQFHDPFEAIITDSATFCGPIIKWIIIQQSKIAKLIFFVV